MEGLAETAGTRVVGRLTQRREKPDGATYLGKGKVEQLHRLVESLVQRHGPPSIEGQPWKVLYATQVKTAPPTFMLFANRKLPRSSPYRRYLENGLRRALDLNGVPLRLVVRKR